MAVFRVTKDFEVVLNPDAVKLVPELRSLDKQQLIYIILVVDYVDSPYRKKPLEERRLMARKHVYQDNVVNPETEKVRLAMKGYKSLVFDIRRETIDVYNTKIKALQKESLGANITFQRMIEIDKTIKFMQDRVAAIQHDLDIEESEEIEIKGKKQLSYLEIWQRNQQSYNEYQQSI